MSPRMLAAASIEKNSPRTRLTSGPTMAMSSSTFGESGSRSMFDTPPKRKSVMLRTGMP